MNFDSLGSQDSLSQNESHINGQPLQARYASSGQLNNLFKLNVLEKHCEQYNRLRIFTSPSSTDPACVYAYQRGAEIGASLKAIDDSIHEFHNRTKAKINQLNQELSVLDDAVHAQKEWYQHGNLLTLSLDSVQNIRLDFSADEWNIDRFTAYLQDLIPGANMLSNVDIDHVFDEHRWRFYDKALELIQILFDHGQRINGLHTLVLLKAVTRKPDKGFYRGRFVDHACIHQRLDDVIRAAVIDDDQIEARHDDSAAAVSQQAARPCRLEQLRWPYEEHDVLPETTSFAKYWDFASAVRSLRTAYLDQPCICQRHRDLLSTDCWRTHRGMKNRCFRTSSIAFLGWLQIAAWSEIRWNVYSTLGQLFAPELTERIFECALEVEGVPLDPATEEAITASPPPSIVETLQARAQKNEVPQAALWKRAKPTYRCCHLERPPPRELFTDNKVRSRFERRRFEY